MEPQRWARAAAVAALLGLHYLMAVSAASQKSMTFDEMAHLTAGYTYWAFNDYRLHPENGNWPQRLGALPAVIGGASFPRRDQPAWTTSNVYALGDQYLYDSGNDAQTLLRNARAVMALLGVATGALIFGWASRLVSPLGAWVSLLLFVFSPTMLAHDPLVTSDIAAAFFFMAATGAIWAALHRVTPMTVLGAGLLAAGCLLSKISGPILVPIALVLLAVRLIGARPLAIGLRRTIVEYSGRTKQLVVLLGVLAVIALIAWTFLWASYGFRYTAFAVTPTGKEAFLGQVKDQPGVVGGVLSLAEQFHLLPQAYIYASRLTVQFASVRAAFLNGHFATTGWWWYFPYAFVVKTTIPAMIVGLLALAGLVTRWRDAHAAGTSVERAKTSLYAGTPLLALVGVYWVFAITSKLNIGHRHLLPIYPALCILAGAAAFWLQSLVGRTPVDETQSRTARPARRARGHVRRTASIWPRAAGIATVALLAWHVTESVAVRPDYLAYFNELVGGPANGYLHLADSSLDWGQDLPALKRWLDREGLQRPGAGLVYLSYFGTSRPEYYGIQATPLAGFMDRRPPQAPVPLGGGVYCVSATMLDVIGNVFYAPEYEKNYQAALSDLTSLARASESEQEWSALMQRTGDQYWQQLFVQFDRLRAGRLMAYLRRRQPDAMVGYSILIYRLTDTDVAVALTGPAPGGPA